MPELLAEEAQWRRRGGSGDVTHSVWLMGTASSKAAHVQQMFDITPDCQSPLLAVASPVCRASAATMELPAAWLRADAALTN